MECKTCSGTGAKDGKTITCHHCQGQGRVRVRQQIGPFVNEVVQECRECGGTGSIIESPCDDCSGRGHRIEERTNWPILYAENTYDYSGELTLATMDTSDVYLISVDGWVDSEHRLHIVIDGNSPDLRGVVQELDQETRFTSHAEEWAW